MSLIGKESKSKSAFLLLRPNQTYPTILLNDGNLDFLSSLSESVILVGLTSKNRHRWLHSLEGSSSERWSSRFWRSGQRLSWSFIWRSFRQVAVALSPGRNSPCLWRLLTRWFGGESTVFSALTRFPVSSPSAVPLVSCLWLTARQRQWKI